MNTQLSITINIPGGIIRLIEGEKGTALLHQETQDLCLETALDAKTVSALAHAFAAIEEGGL